MGLYCVLSAVAGGPGSGLLFLDLVVVAAALLLLSLPGCLSGLPSRNAGNSGPVLVVAGLGQTRFLLQILQRFPPAFQLFSAMAFPG